MPNYTYKNCRFEKDGKPFFVIASDYHFFRDRREHWEDRLAKLKKLGVRLITFYTPWRHFLQTSGGEIWYDFTGKTKDSRDLVTFLELLKKLDLLGIFKPGPFVHSELNVGGLPDIATPTFNPEIPGMRRFDDSPVRWCYDNAILPAPCDPTYDALVKGWYEAVCPIVAPHASPAGPVVAMQLNDETIFCCSNDPPWRLGYEPSSMQFFHGLLAERYGTIEQYNEAHDTDHASFNFVTGPQPLDASRLEEHKPKKPADVLSYVDWANHQWRLRRDNYVHYKGFTKIDLPFLTNYAGITPPIEQNIPEITPDNADVVPAELAKTYSDWWFAMNRVDQDVVDGAHEYGMISWLGVAAYDEVVFDRYVNTARRRRGINMEENLGFAAFYDERSKCPIVPVFQTLVSIAAGATGYDIYTGISTDYWDDTLDRVTKKQCATFPSDAPINKDGEPGVLYDAAASINAWFGEHGNALLTCEPDQEAAYLLYAPYAAVASWVPDEQHWAVKEHDLPRCGYEAFEPWASSLQQAGFSPVAQELETTNLDWMLVCKSVAIHAAFFMGQAEQQKLAEFIKAGGRLFISGELPTVDMNLKPCTVLKEAVEGADNNVTYQRENLFADGNFAARLTSAGLDSRVTCSDRLRTMVHFGERDRFVFFFNLEAGVGHAHWIEFDGTRIELQLGSKSCGILRVVEGTIVSHFVKGRNEIDDTTADIRIQCKQIIAGQGDFTDV